MGTHSNIEWCDSTFNPWLGCTKVSPGCDHCYAERQMDQRLGRVRWGAGQPRQRTSAENWRQPERWNGQPLAECAVCGLRSENPLMAQCRGPGRSQHLWQPARRRVFCASLADVFDGDVPTDWRRDLYALIERTPNLDWLVLTKRIGNARAMLGECSFGRWDSTPLPNIWLGATVVNQAEADRDVPKLLATPAAKRFISVEPMLGPVDVGRWIQLGRCKSISADGLRCGLPLDHCEDHSAFIESSAPWLGVPNGSLNWVICGGESGPGARPMHPDWVRSLRDQCLVSGVPFLFKQWGDWEICSLANGHFDCDMASNKAWWLDIDGKLAKPSCIGLSEHARAMIRVGKHAAGRTLDGREWLEFPT